MIKILRSIIVLVLIILIGSCSEEKEAPVGKTTVAEDKQNIDLSIEEFYKSLQGISTGALGNYLLYSLSSGQSQQLDDSHIGSILKQFENEIGSIFQEDRLRFNPLKGIHEFQNSGWINTGNSAGMILKFPSRQSSSSMDCEVSLFDFEDVAAKFNARPIYLPAKGRLYMKRFDETVGSVLINSIQYDQTNPDYSIPLFADISVFTAPYTHTIKLNKTAPTTYQINYELNSPNRPTTALELRIELVDSDLSSLTSIENDVKSISGFAKQGNLRVSFSVNVLAISAYSSPSVAQINQFSDAEVYFNNFKIGDLSYEDVDGSEIIFVTYSDGTKEDVAKYTGNFEERFLAIFDDFKF
jgi:hypothetical protein